jgi:hypothetical protein
MGSKQFSILFALVALLSLTGSECVIVAKSGSSHDKDEEKRSGLVVVLSDGQFIDAPVQGMGFVSGSVSGITGPDGEFQYEAGQPVRFFIGDIVLGEGAEGGAVVTPLDLVPGGDIDTPAVINIARLLQSLDAVPGDERITLPDTVHTTALRGNEALFASIEFMDFHDEAAFVNAASQIVAVLTAS